jgi:hypothetical protein
MNSRTHYKVKSKIYNNYINLKHSNRLIYIKKKNTGFLLGGLIFFSLMSGLWNWHRRSVRNLKVI